MAQILTLLFYLFLVDTLQIQVSSAVTDVFVKTGDDLILNLTAKVPPDAIWSWQFKNKAIATFITGIKSTVQESHAGRIEIDEKSKFKLKNLLKSDSGIYIAKVAAPRDEELTQYNVTVQDPVSPVDLTFTCSSSSSSYNLTATCRTDDISVTLRCDYLTCDQEEEERRSITRSGSSLLIYKSKESIVCSHSNRVSRIETINQIDNHCFELAKRRIMTIINITRIILAALLVVVFTVTVVIRKCKRKTKPEEVMYEFPE
ncbi:uncharacterized protein LOC129356796 [Poeciliopsis prolifica]|uniref:uncharacterized protein LOC129356796 n=1 Tax=Poeciliopsis prolifica TaxID=188132 RepID=UPI00241442BB|nr:uncharacterized protein LOC129356796 [Poeciliopsis prolifica]